MMINYGHCIKFATILLLNITRWKKKHTFCIVDLHNVYIVVFLLLEKNYFQFAFFIIVIIYTIYCFLCTLLNFMFCFCSAFFSVWFVVVVSIYLIVIVIVVNETVPTFFLYVITTRFLHTRTHHLHLKPFWCAFFIFFYFPWILIVEACLSTTKNFFNDVFVSNLTCTQFYVQVHWKFMHYNNHYRRNIFLFSHRYLCGCEFYGNFLCTLYTSYWFWCIGTFNSNLHLSHRHIHNIQGYKTIYIKNNTEKRSVFGLVDCNQEIYFVRN